MTADAAVDDSARVDVAAMLDEGPWTRYQKLLVLLTALTIVFDGVDNQILPIAAPAIMQDLAVGRGALAPVLASGLFGMMIGGAAGGIVGDRVGRRVGLLGSVALFAVFTMAVAVVNDLGTLAVLRFVAGLGLGGAMPNAAALAAEYVPRRQRPLAVTLTIVCIPLGGTLAALAGGVLLPAFGWRALFAGAGMLPLAVAIVLAFALPESPRYLARHRARWPELRLLLRRTGRSVPDDATFHDAAETVAGRASASMLFTPDLRRDTLALWMAFFCCLLSVYAAVSWVPVLLTGIGFDLSIAGRGLAAFNLGGVVGAIVGGYAILRIGSRATLVSLCALAIAGSVVLSAMPLAATSPAVPLVVMLAIVGGSINAVQTTMYAVAAHVYPAAIRATGVGTAVAVGRSGGVVSPYAGAWALEAGGHRTFFLLVAATMTAVLGALAIVRRHVPRSR